MATIMQGGSQPRLYEPKRPALGSLNHDRRKKEQLKITSENQAFLKRLQEQGSTYSVNQWSADFQKNQQLKLKLTEYRPDSRGTAQTIQHDAQVTGEDGDYS